jgi:hypothetical protein
MPLIFCGGFERFALKSYSRLKMAGLPPTFLMTHIATTLRESQDVSALGGFVCAAVDRLADEVSAHLTASVMMCLSSVRLDKVQRLRFLALARGCFAWGVPVVQHAALRLFWRHFPIRALDPEIGSGPIDWPITRAY